MKFQNFKIVKINIIKKHKKFKTKNLGSKKYTKQKNKNNNSEEKKKKFLKYLAKVIKINK